MLFDGLKKPKDLTPYTLMAGVTDFGNAAQWDLFEGGYGQVIVISIPKFLEVLGKKYSDIQVLINNYIHILEHEFKGLDGIENITAENMEVADGISTMQLINKVNQQSGGQISMRYTEKSGSTITKLHELFLKGIKDARTQVKTYHGLIHSGEMEPGFENEIFTLMYFVCDNTMMNIERAFLILCAQPTSAQFDIYNIEKGNYENKEITVEFNGFVVEGKQVTQKAKEVLDWMNSDQNPAKWQWNSDDYLYSIAPKTTIDSLDPKISHL